MICHLIKILDYCLWILWMAIICAFQITWSLKMIVSCLRFILVVHIQYLFGLSTLYTRGEPLFLPASVMISDSKLCFSFFLKWLHHHFWHRTPILTLHSVWNSVESFSSMVTSPGDLGFLRRLRWPRGTFRSGLCGGADGAAIMNNGSSRLSKRYNKSKQQTLNMAIETRIHRPIPQHLERERELCKAERIHHTQI